MTNPADKLYVMAATASYLVNERHSTVFGSFIEYIVWCRTNRISYTDRSSCEAYILNHKAPSDLDIFAPNIGIAGTDGGCYTVDGIYMSYPGQFMGLCSELVNTSGDEIEVKAEKHTGRHYYGNSSIKMNCSACINRGSTLNFTIDFCHSPDRMLFSNGTPVSDFDISKLLFAKPDKDRPAGFFIYDGQPVSGEFHAVPVVDSPSVRLMIRQILAKKATLIVDVDSLPDEDKARIDDRIARIKARGFTLVV